MKLRRRERINTDLARPGSGHRQPSAPVGSSERHAAELDEVDTEWDGVDPAFRATLKESLAQLTAVPADLGSRTSTSVIERLTEQSLLGAMSDLCTIGWQTIGVLVGPPDPIPSPNHEPTEQEPSR